ncbi:hypothetical protein Vadar_030700 [Vaccinium darrowii]|uniref:Uncharacterized protein n=1 Tax=Vaccinium darrowii TaxID=229202 RepID=A0ACB7YAL1_9ERIC|nr:hypothetical protein Vadar_030700 [Vaccinium darrowii]
MEEEIRKKISSFVLTNEEDEAVEILAGDFKASKQDCLLSAIGKIITQKGINLSGLKAAMEAIWGYPRGFKVMEVGGGIYQFVFGCEMDLLRVLSGSPWIYNNQLIVLQRWTERLAPNEISFTFSPFWIQLRALSLKFMSVDVGKRMMAGFGDVEEANIAQLSGNQGWCIRVKVELNINKPLSRGKKVYTADWKLIWVPFRYEKLPVLCHYCGVVGHDDRACMIKNQEAKDGIVKEDQYGGWMKASSVKLPPRRRAEGQPEYSSAESSAERSSFGKSEDHGNDLRDSRKSGDSERGKRQLQWDSNKEEDARMALEVGQARESPFSKELDKTKRWTGPCLSPSRLWEDPASIPIGVLQNGGKTPPDIQGFFGESKENLTKKTKQIDKGTTRLEGSTAMRGYKRKGQASGRPAVSAEKVSKGVAVVPSKRKSDEKGVEEQSIDETILNQPKRQKLGLTIDELINLYASSCDSVRRLQWEELNQYRQQCSDDWMIWGDFNDLLEADEKQGGRRREIWSLRAFREFVTKLGAVDLGYAGYPFTWVNRRWTGDAGCTDVVRKSWPMGARGSKMFDLFHRVRNTRKELRVWSKARNFNSRKKINEVQSRLQEIGEERIQGDMGQIRSLEKELGDAWVQEERYLRQKSRISWMVEGDRNTSFFQAKVTQRRKRNNISGIQDAFGNWCENQEEIAKELYSIFRAYFNPIAQLTLMRWWELLKHGLRIR